VRGGSARDERAGDVEAPASTTEIASPSEGVAVPERTVLKTLDPEFDASHEITLEVPEGYTNQGFAFLKSGLDETGVSVWVVDRVYADGCESDVSRLERSPDGSIDGLTALLASQNGFRVSEPADVTVDGFSGTYMERTLPASIDPSHCYTSSFQVWLTRDNGNRYLRHAGQRDLLWILDVEGAPLVIDAPLDAEASGQDRAEVLRMVESLQINAR
jgi:hypothetical protein